MFEKSGVQEVNWLNLKNATTCLAMFENSKIKKVNVSLPPVLKPDNGHFNA